MSSLIIKYGFLCIVVGIFVYWPYIDKHTHAHTRTYTDTHLHTHEHKLTQGDGHDVLTKMILVLQSLFLYNWQC